MKLIPINIDAMLAYYFRDDIISHQHGGEADSAVSSYPIVLKFERSYVLVTLGITIFFPLCENNTDKNEMA